MLYTQKAIKNSTIIFVFTIIATLTGYLLRIYLSRSLSIEDFGLFYAVNAFIAFFVTFQGFGTSTSLIKFLPEFILKKEASKIKSSVFIVLIIQLVILSIFTAVVFAFSDSLAMILFKTIEASMIIKILMLSLVAGTFYLVFQFTFQGFQRMKAYALIEPVRIISVFILSSILIYLGALGVAYAYLLAAIITSIVFFLPFVKIFKQHFGNSILKIESRISDRGLWKKLILFGFPVFVGTIASFIIGYIDTIMLSLFTNLKQVALYQVALPTSQFLWVFAATLAVVMVPMISELYAKKEKKILEQNISFFANISLFIVVPFVVVLFTFPEIIINLLFGSKYILASEPLRILAIGSVFYTIFCLFQNSLIAIGKPKINTKIIIFMSIINIILNLVLIPGFGIVGAAITSAISFLIGAITSYIFLRKFLIVRISYKRLSKIFLSAVLSVITIFLIKGILIIDNQWLEVVISVVPGAIVYIGVIFITKAITREDFKSLRKLGIPLPKWI
ncbi:flippase [Candidatus Aenigmatarchaeota archaeon]